MTMDTGDLLGRSLAFPPRVDASGRMVWSEGEANVRESIRIILTTSPRERMLLPEFGAGLDQFLSEPSTVSTWHKIEQRVRAALVLWEPRISLLAVTVEPDSESTSAVIVTITYRLVATRAEERMTLAISVGG
jgi:phage baseplate assembly protein W